MNKLITSSHSLESIYRIKLIIILVMIVVNMYIFFQYMYFGLFIVYEIDITLYPKPWGNELMDIQPYMTFYSLISTQYGT